MSTMTTPYRFLVLRAVCWTFDCPVSLMPRKFKETRQFLLHEILEGQSGWNQKDSKHGKNLQGRQSSEHTSHKNPSPLLTHDTNLAPTMFEKQPTGCLSNPTLSADQ